MNDTVILTGSDGRAMTAAQEELLERVRARRVLPIAEDRKRIREDAKVSQHEMARALGVSWTAIWRWENGARPREHRNEVAYADLLNELKRFAPEEVSA